MPTVYSLKNPINNEIYYVGYTEKTISERLIGHLASLVHETTKSLAEQGLSPIIEIIEEGVNVNKVTELYWIQKYSADGHKLENRDGLINYQSRNNAGFSDEELLKLYDLEPAEQYLFALNKIKAELPLSSNIPIVLRIKNIIETVVSLLGNVKEQGKVSVF